MQSVKKVLTGDLEYAQVNKDSIMKSEYVDPSEYNFEPSAEEIALREKVAQKEKQKKK